MSQKRFTFSNSFQSTFEQKKQQKEKKASHSKDKGKFKLDPNAGSQIEGLPVEILRKKSRNKLQSLNDKSEQKNKWSIINQKIQVNKQSVSDKKFGPKKYNLSVSIHDKNNNNKDEKKNSQVDQLPYDIVRPSKLDSQEFTKIESQSSIFQTPILPCFASQFSSHPQINNSEYKQIKEKEGVWKIGKIKIKGKNAKLMINGIQFQASSADIQGKAGSVLQTNIYQLPKWSGFWVVQPSPKIFSHASNEQQYMPMQH